VRANPIKLIEGGFRHRWRLLSLRFSRDLDLNWTTVHLVELQQIVLGGFQGVSLQSVTTLAPAQAPA
jgi:hypothetical protein